LKHDSHKNKPRQAHLLQQWAEEHFPLLRPNRPSLNRDVVKLFLA